jgi:uncharacterized membrane protein
VMYPGGFIFGFGFLSLLAVAAGVVLLVIWAVRASGRPMYPVVPPSAQPPPQHQTPLDILARRFASGEITAEEYEKGRDLLGGGGKTS